MIAAYRCFIWFGVQVCACLALFCVHQLSWMNFYNDFLIMVTAYFFSYTASIMQIIWVGVKLPEVAQI